jgi:dihydrofolate synthase/folylpolyglutamate synthase
MAQVAKLSAIPFREGVEFSVKSRALAVGGQLITLQGLHTQIDDIFLPLYGQHQANNAAVALAAVEAFSSVALDEELVRDAFSKVASPGRCEIVYKDPTVIIDAAHNPHGAAAISKTINDEFDFQMVVGVVGVMADKDVDGILEALASCLDYLVVSQSSSSRAMSAPALAEIAGKYFKAEQIEVIADLPTAITYAVEKVSLANQVNEGVGAVLVTGSVVTAGVARTKLKELGSTK